MTKIDFGKQLRKLDKISETHDCTHTRTHTHTYTHQRGRERERQTGRAKVRKVK